MVRHDALGMVPAENGTVRASGQGSKGFSASIWTTGSYFKLIKATCWEDGGYFGDIR